jgi:hypothetical protein
MKGLMSFSSRAERRAAKGQRPLALGRHEQSAGTVRVRPQLTKPARPASRQAGVPPGDGPAYPQGEGHT